MTAPFDRPFQICYNTITWQRCHLLNPLALGEPMTIKHVTLSSIIPAKNTVIDNIVIDGYVDGQPMQFVRMADNRVKPAIGTTVHTPYGVGTVARYSQSNRLVVAINKFNADFEFITADETDIYDAQEYVERAASAMNVGVASDRETFTRLYKSEITGRLSDRNNDRMCQAYQWFDDNEVVVNGSNQPLQPTDMVVARIIGNKRETPSERKARIKREQAMATKMANAMLLTKQDDAIPDDVLAEMSAIYGE